MPRDKNLEENLLYAHKHMSYVSLLLALSHFPAVYEGYQKPVLTVVLSEKREVQTGCKETLFHHENSQALEQVDQRGCASSVLGGFRSQSE